VLKVGVLPSPGTLAATQPFRRPGRRDGGLPIAWIQKRDAAARCRRRCVLLALAALGLVLPGLSRPTPAEALQPQDRVAVRDAFEAAEASEWQRAFAFLAPLDDPLPAKTLRWLRMAEGDGRESFAEIAGFLTANPAWPLPERLQQAAESRIVDPADHDLVRRFFADRPPLTTRGHIRYAEALLAAGERERAQELLRRAYVEGDFSASEGRRFYNRYGRVLTESDHAARLDNLLWNDRLGAASRMLDRVPGGQRRLAEARLRLQRQDGGVDRAIEAVPAALRNDPGLTFDRLRWRRLKHRHDDAVQILLDPPAQLVRPEVWWFEREYQIRRAIRERDFDLAHELARRHGQRAGLDFAEAEWLAGWLALRFADEPREALRRFISLYDGVGTPISRARASYWAGRAAGALEDDATAATWFRIAARHRTTFYGQLAAAELDGDPQTGAILPPAAIDRAAFESRELVRVVRMLNEAGVADATRPFLMRLAGAAGTPEEVGLVSDLAAEASRPDLVTLVGKYASYNGVVHEGATFPIPDIGALLKPAASGPEPALLLGVARQESVFNPLVVSSAGARGLLQLMPGTASLMARELRLPYNLGLLTGDPEYNVRLGSHYLQKMMGRYGNLGLAIAAYNAGPTRVDAWLRLQGDPRGEDLYALIDWLELIPFAETRNYVQRVLENHAVYRRLLAQPEPTLVAMRRIAGPIDPPPQPALRPLSAAGSAQLAEQEEADAPTPVAPVEAAQELPLPKLKPASVALAPTPAAKPSG
jgi:soluble lytic murein transglycosylase